MKQSKRSTSAAFSKKTVSPSPNQDGDKKPMDHHDDSRDVRGKASRQEIRNETHRVNVPRQSRRPAERSK